MLKKSMMIVDGTYAAFCVCLFNSIRAAKDGDSLIAGLTINTDMNKRTIRGRNKTKIWRKRVGNARRRMGITMCKRR